MGCDIHMFAEKRNPVTNEWDVVGEEFTDSYALWELSKDLKDTFGMEEEESWEIMMKWINGKNLIVDKNNILWENISQKELHPQIRDGIMLMRKV